MDQPLVLPLDNKKSFFVAAGLTLAYFATKHASKPTKPKRKKKTKKRDPLHQYYHRVRLASWIHGPRSGSPPPTLTIHDVSSETTTTGVSVGDDVRSMGTASAVGGSVIDSSAGGCVFESSLMESDEEEPKELTPRTWDTTEDFVFPTKSRLSEESSDVSDLSSIAQTDASRSLRGKFLGIPHNDDCGSIASFKTAEIDGMPELPFPKPIPNYQSSGEDSATDGYMTDDETTPVQPPDFAPTMQTVLESEITVLTSRLEQLQTAVHRLNDQREDPIYQVFEELPDTEEFKGYRQVISDRTHKGLSLRYVRYHDLRDWGIKNAHHRQLLIDRITTYTSQDKSAFLLDLFSPLPKTPGFRGYLRAFREHKVTQESLRWIDDQALKAFGAESQIHRSILMRRIEEYISTRNFLDNFFKDLPHNLEFRFYRTVFDHHDVDEMQLHMMTDADLIEMGIVDRHHRIQILAQAGTSRIDFSNLEDQEEDSSSHGSDFMDEVYHSPTRTNSIFSGVSKVSEF